MNDQRAALAIVKTLADPCCSQWLYDCLTSALKRDPLDATRDAAKLLELLSARQHALRMS